MVSADNMQAEAIEDTDPIQAILELLERASREILASQLTVADVIEYFENEVISPAEEIGNAKIRYLIGEWLIRMNSFPEAIQQFQVAEVEFVSRLGSPERSDALAYLSLVLSQQAKCYITVDHDKATLVLDRAIDYLFQGVSISTESHGTSSSSDIEVSEALRDARSIFRRRMDDELRVGLAIVSVRYAQALTLAPHFSVDEILEASLWFKLAHDCIMILPPENHGSMAMVPECFNLAMFFFTGVLPSLGLESEEEAESKFSHLFELIDYYTSDEIQNRFSYIIEQAKQSTPPLKIITEMMASSGDLDDASLLSLRGKLDPEINQVDLWLCTFLLGRGAVQRGEISTGLELLGDSWERLAKLLPPGHPWRVQIQLWLARAYREANDDEKSIFFAVASLAEGLVNAFPWELFFTQYLYIAHACAAQSTVASIFFGKLAALGWLEFYRNAGSIQAAAAMVTPPEYLLLELARWMSRAGRLAEAFQVIRLNEAHDLERSAGMGAKSRFVPAGPISLTPSENLQLDIIRGAMETVDADPRERVETIRAALMGILIELGQEEERFEREIADLQTALTEQQMRRLPRIGKKTALISFCAFHDGIDVTLITETGAESVQIDESDEAVSRLIFEFLRCVRAEVEDSIWMSHRTMGEKLYNILFGGLIRERLEEQGVQCLAILAAGVFRFLPFSALNNGSNYLLERFSIVLLSEFPIDLTIEPEFPERIALLGAEFKGAEVSQLGKLLNVADELDSIRYSLASREMVRRVEVLDLREERFNLEEVAHAFDGSYNLIHIASHFSADPSDIGKSILWLGDGHALLVEELRQMMSAGLERVDLIVLSACDTGQPAGRWQPGTIHSFSGLLHGLGARCVLNTLWSVADLSTSLLVGLFYRFLFEMKVDKVEALRRAQLSLLSDPRHAHPYYWAAFTLSGNWLAFNDAS